LATSRKTQFHFKIIALLAKSAAIFSGMRNQRQPTSTYSTLKNCFSTTVSIEKNPFTANVQTLPRVYRGYIYFTKLASSAII